jgi:lipopolysaccharide export LptBFGC system permease protein LptF
MQLLSIYFDRRANAHDFQLSISEHRADTMMPQPQPQESQITRKTIDTAVPPSSTSLLSNTSMPIKNLTPLVNIDNNNAPGPKNPYQLGLHSIVDAIQFVVFLTLTLLAFAFILVLGGFYVATLVLFPCAEIPTGFTRISKHWKRFNDFYADLFNKLFSFGSGLWD